jgi:hypothetical protein
MLPGWYVKTSATMYVPKISRPLKLSLFNQCVYSYIHITVEYDNCYIQQFQLQESFVSEQSVCENNSSFALAHDPDA